MRRLFFLMFPLILSTLASPGEAVVGQERARPKIGIALSGGGARGCAHIGVLAELERRRIPVDLIAGVSMGAVIGGIYSTGMPIAEIDHQMRTIDWSEALSDRTDYRRLDYRRKEDEQRYLLEFQIGWNDGLRWPSGLRSGQKLKFLLQKFTHSAAVAEDFSHLPIPFKTLAADIETGDVVVLESGDLATALHASMAIPGVFSPVEIEGRLLVDGGIVNNLPVDVLREMGADIVIAVDVSTPLAGRESLAGYFAITGQAMNLLARKNMESQLEAADLVIAPEVQGIGSLDFSDVGSIIELGHRAAVSAEEALRSWALPQEDWSQHLSRRRAPALPPLRIEAIRIDGLKRTDPRRLRSRIHLEPGPLDLEAVRQDLERIFGLGEFERASFDLEPGSGENSRILVLKLVEKSWGPNYLHQSLQLSGDLDGSTEFAFLANLSKTQITRRGGEWRTDFFAGARDGVLTELYLPMDWRGRFFVAPSAVMIREDQEFFLDRQLTSTFELETRVAGLDLGVQFGRWGELRLGARRGRVDADIEIGDLSFPETTIQTGGLQMQLTLDTLDAPIVPRRGVLVSGSLQAQRESFGADASYDKLEATANAFFSFGDHCVAVGVDVGTNLGSTIPIYDEFLIGGLFSLGGYADGELNGQRYGIGRLIYYHQLLNLPSTFGKGIYLGGVLEGGNTWAEEVDFKDLRYSATAFLLAETILGPVFFGYGRSDESTDRFYLTIGRTF